MYRTAPVSAPHDALVVCRACAVEKRITLDAQKGDTFECSVCRFEQPVLRESDDLAVKELVYVSRHPSSHTELVPFLETISKDVGSSAQITLNCDGIELQLSLSIDSGTVVGLAMVATAAGLPAVTFEREMDAHRQAESKGIVKELKTGDASFDDEVYIASDAANTDVATMLTSPAVRAAIQNLLFAGEIRIANGSARIVARLSDEPFSPNRIRERLGWLRALVGAPRRLEPTRVELPPIAKLFTTLAYALMPIGVLSTILGAKRYTPMTATPWFAGVACGVVVAALLQPLVTLALKGRSTSLADIRRMRLSTFIGLPVVMLGCVLNANGVFDRSEAHRVEMPVLKATIDDDDSSKIGVTTRDELGDGHFYSFDAPIPGERSRVVLYVKQGAFGWRWYVYSPELVRSD